MLSSRTRDGYKKEGEIAFYSALGAQSNKIVYITVHVGSGTAHKNPFNTLSLLPALGPIDGYGDKQHCEHDDGPDGDNCAGQGQFPLKAAEVIEHGEPLPACSLELCGG